MGGVGRGAGGVIRMGNFWAKAKEIENNRTNEAVSKHTVHSGAVRRVRQPGWYRQRRPFRGSEPTRRVDRSEGGDVNSRAAHNGEI